MYRIRSLICYHAVAICCLAVILLCSDMACAASLPEGSVLLESESAVGEWEIGRSRAELASGGLSGGAALVAGGSQLSATASVDLPPGRYSVWVRSYADGYFPGLYAYSLRIGDRTRRLADSRRSPTDYWPFRGYAWERWGSCSGGRKILEFSRPGPFLSCSDCVLFSPNPSTRPDIRGAVRLIGATLSEDDGRDRIVASVRLRVLTPLPPGDQVSLVLCTKNGFPISRLELPVPEDKQSFGDEIFYQNLIFPSVKHYSCNGIELRARVGDCAIVGALDKESTVATMNLPKRDNPGFPKCVIQRINGVPRILVNGKPLTGFAFLGLGDPKYVKEVYDAGIRLFTFDPGMGNTLEGPINTDQVDAAFASFFALNPEAYVFPRIYSITSPQWWMERNPEELCLFDSGKTGPQSFASVKWREELGEQFRQFVEHLKNAPYADRIIGIHVCSGGTAEWQSWGLHENERGDFSAPNTHAYRKWMAESLPPETTREILGPSAAASQAEVPRRARREVGGSSIFHPNPDAALYYQFYPQPAVESIEHFCKIAKEASDGRLLVGVFYGYQMQFGGAAQESQHLAMEQVVNLPYVDFLCSPSMYSHREPGGTSTFMSVAESVHLRGKLWFTESDNRTHLTDPNTAMEPVGRAKTKAETMGVLKREFGHVISRGAAQWWFDMAGGWFSDPDILKLFTQMNDYRASIFDDPSAAPLEQEVAFLLDDLNTCFLRPYSGFLGLMGFEFFSSLPTLGAPYGTYLLADADKLPESVKLVVVMNAYRLDPKQMSTLSKLGRPGRSVLWIYAPGLYEAQPGVLGRMQPAQMQQLTGIKLQVEPAGFPLTGQALLPDGGQSKFDAGEAIPGIHCADPAADIIGTYDCNSRGAIAVKDRGGWFSMWCAVPCVPIPVLRHLAEKAGVHIYSDSGDTFYAGHGTVTIHANHSGRKTIRLPQRAHVQEIFSSEPLSLPTSDVIELEMPAYDTRLFRVHTLPAS